MSDDEIVLFAQRIVMEKEIQKISELKANDSGLYRILRERKLQDQVFDPIEKQRKNQALREIAEAVEEFS